MNISYLADSYSFFNQRHIISKFYNDMICSWILQYKSLDFLYFSITKFIEKIKCIFNLSDFTVTEMKISFNDKSNIYINENEDMYKGFTIIICLIENIDVFFEDTYNISIGNGDAIIFYNDIRYSIISEIYKENIIVINLYGNGKFYDDLDEWWILDKKYEKKLMN